MLPGTGTVVWFEYNQSFQTVKCEETWLQKVSHITRIKRALIQEEYRWMIYNDPVNP